jgi:Flp pilus assembly protein TadG
MVFKRENGASAVEFALLFLPLAFLIFGIFQFGIVFNNWIAINHAAREGVRLAAVGKDEQEIKDEIINSAPSVKIDREDIIIENLHEEIGTPVTVTVTGNQIDLNFLALLKIVEITSSATLNIEQDYYIGN